MPAVIICPSCQAWLKAPEATVGKTVQCPKCKSKVIAKAAANIPARPADPAAAIKPSAVQQPPAKTKPDAAPREVDGVADIEEIAEVEAVAEVEQVPSVRRAQPKKSNVVLF